MTDPMEMVKDLLADALQASPQARQRALTDPQVSHDLAVTKHLLAEVSVAMETHGVGQLAPHVVRSVLGTLVASVEAQVEARKFDWVHAAFPNGVSSTHKPGSVIW